MIELTVINFSLVFFLMVVPLVAVILEGLMYSSIDIMSVWYTIRLIWIICAILTILFLAVIWAVSLIN